MLSVSLAGDGLTVPVCESGNVAEAASLSLAHDCAAPIEVITIPLAQFWISQNATDPTQVHLAWPEAEGADGYYIYTYQNGTSIFLASVGPDETQFAISDLAPGQTHHFLIQAHSDDGLVSSPWQSVTTPALAAPSWISLESTGPTQVQLEWSDVKHEDGYYIYTYQNGASVFLASVGPDETQFTARDLAPGQTHHFLIQAHNEDGLVSSPWQSVTTLPALAAPNWINLEATGPTQVQLEWSDVEGENGYDIYAFSHPTIDPVLPGESGFVVTPTFVLSFLASVGPNETQFTVSDLAPGHTHYFYIEARYDNGVARSALRSVTTPAMVSPNWISLEATGPTQVQLKWSDVEREDGYYVYTYQNGASVFLASVGPDETQFTAGDLAPGQTHHFLIQAHNEDGLVSSPWQSVTTIELLPVLLPLPCTDLASDRFGS